MVEIPLRGKVKDPQRHAYAVRASKRFVAGLLGVTFVLGLYSFGNLVEALAVMGFLSVTLSALPIVFIWYMLGDYSHPLTTVYTLRLDADDVVLRDPAGIELGSLRGGQFTLVKTNAEIWKNRGTKHAQSTLSAVLQAQGPAGPFFILPDVAVAPNAECMTTTSTTSYEVPQAAYFQIARHAADPPRM